MSFAPTYILPEVTIHCPECGGEAKFIFAKARRILNKDVEFYRRSKSFEVKRLQDTNGSFYKAAVHFPGIGTAIENATNLPSGHNPAQWRHKPSVLRHSYLYNTGVLHCRKCLRRKKHKLNWPADAYFKIDFKGQTLWAYDRKYALMLLEYIESDGRKKRIVGTAGGHSKIYSQHFFLRKIPTHFQTAKARPIIVKKLKKLLGV